MDNGPHPSMSRGVVQGFAERKAQRQTVKTGQMQEKPLDDLFKPEKKMDRPKPDAKPDAGIDIGLEEGMDKDVMPEEKMSFDEIKSAIENFEGTPDEIEELCDLCQDKLMGSKSDGLDTEMDRGEAEMKNDIMKKDKPLGVGGMEGAMPPMAPASAAPSPMR